MRLTNYWWLLIWLVLAGGFLQMTFPKQPVRVLGRTEYRWHWIPAIILAVPYMVWAANRVWIGDTEVYRSNFLSVPMSLPEFSDFLSQQAKDKGFTVLSFALKQLIGNQDVLFFLIIAAFQMFCVVYFFRKYSTNFLLCFFMFVASTDYLSWVFNGMRQFIAVGLTLLCFGLILKKKYVVAIVLICLAGTIHGSALLMIPVIFVVQGQAWNKRTMLMIVAVAVVVMFIGQFTPVLDSLLAETQYGDMMSGEIWAADDGTNILRVLFYSVPAFMALVGRQQIRDSGDPVINLCTNYAIVTALFYVLSAVTSGIYIGRIPIYTTFPGYVVAAWLLERIFTRNSVKLAKGVYVVIYLVFFYYQMHYTWGFI